MAILGDVLCWFVHLGVAVVHSAGDFTRHDLIAKSSAIEENHWERKSTIVERDTSVSPQCIGRTVRRIGSTHHNDLHRTNHHRHQPLQRVSVFSPILSRHMHVSLSLTMFRLIYAVMYSFFKSFPLVYGEGGYGWGEGVSTLPFLGLVVGEGIGVGGYALWNWYVGSHFPSLIQP